MSTPIDHPPSTENTETEKESDENASSDAKTVSLVKPMTVMIPVLLVLTSLLASALVLALGITSKQSDQDERFESRSLELITSIQAAWEDYEVQATWLHNACKNRDLNRTEFREVYEHTISNGLAFQAAECILNITREGRKAAEEEARNFFEQNYPSINYAGFRGLEPSQDDTNDLTLQVRSEQPFYFPVRFVEPIVGNEVAIDFDLYSSPNRRATIHTALETFAPALTDRLRLVQETEESAYSVLLLHPGIVVSTRPDEKARDLACLVIRFPALMERALKGAKASLQVYIFDTTSTKNEPVFLVGARTTGKSLSGEEEHSSVRFAGETSMADILGGHSRSREYEAAIPVANKEWTILVLPDGDDFKEETSFVIFGGVMIAAAGAVLAIFALHSIRRNDHLNTVRAAGEREKTLLLVESSRQQAESERNFTDFLAHEVRNPLATATSALAFALSDMDSKAFPKGEKASIKDDLNIVQESLNFVNNLLRSMLDMHRAGSNQMHIRKAPTDLLKDVFEPLRSMLQQRDADYEIIVECPVDLVVNTDRLRLSQVMMNLGRNAAKFVTSGYVKFHAFTNDVGNVQLSIEDSGVGIPMEKRDRLFAKFQESLDNLNQGTGIGLFLSKQIVELLGGQLWLDEEFRSGYKHFPGTRFVVDLNVPPLNINIDSPYSSRIVESSEEFSCAGNYGTGVSHFDPSPSSSTVCDTCSQKNPRLSNEEEMSILHTLVNKSKDPKNHEQHAELPDHCSVLFVDDDMIQRKLFCRCIKRVLPNWIVQEAASGEAALSLVEDNEAEFDLIFMDQYMASIEKRLLGTETIVQLRAKGVNSIICGLSANDAKAAFIKAGADYFQIKPISTDPDQLKRRLAHFLRRKRK